MILPIIVLWFFLLERPRQKQLAERKDLLRTIKKNDRVITSGGIYGVVTSVQLDAGEVTVRVDETNNTRLRVTLGSIERILGSETPEKQESAK
jgi:preprotein translocase subunit YajC